MLLTPHVLVGAAIGRQFDHAYLVAPLAAASHFALDLFPHWDLRIDLENEDLEKLDILVIILDLATALFLLMILLYRSPYWEMMLVGAVSAAIPDIHHVIQALADPKKWERFARLGRLHGRYSRVHKKFNWDHDSRFIYGIATQVLVGMAAILSVLSF